MKFHTTGAVLLYLALKTLILVAVVDGQEQQQGVRGLQPNCDKDNDGYLKSNGNCGGNDCDDNDSTVNPGQAEICGNGIDDNCDGQVDEGCGGGPAPPTAAPVAAPSPPTGGSTSVLITEIMYDPSVCADSDGEWIELYNSGSSSINLQGWTIQDAANSPVTLNNFELAAGGYFIMARTTNGCGGLNADQTFSFAVNNGGDTLTLKDGSGTIVDEVTYGDDAPSGSTLERKADTNGQPVDTDNYANDWQVGAVGGSPRAGYMSSGSATVLITEIMYNPSACPDSDGEWIEIYNSGSGSVNLQGWTIQDAANSPVTLISFDLSPGGYFIMARTTNGCGGLNADQTFSFAINNSGGDTLTLKDNSGVVVDEVTYGGGDAAPGSTVERKADANGQPVDTDNYTNDWQEGAVGGTPRAGYTSGPTLPPSPTPPPTPAPSRAPAPIAPVSNIDVKVMAYNILASGTGSSGWKDIVKAENPDIIVFTEVGDWDDNNDALLTANLNEFNSYFTGETPYVGNTVQGISFPNSANAIMTRFPIVQFWQLTDAILSSDSAHDLMVWKLDVGNNKFVFVIGIHLKCCGGATNDARRNNTMKNLIDWIDANTGSADGVILAGDFNAVSPVDTDPSFTGYQSGFEPSSGSSLNDDPLRMLLDASHPDASTVHIFKDAFREANPTCGSNGSCCADTLCDSGLSGSCPERGYSYVDSSHDFDSRIDFIIVNDLVQVTGDATVGDIGANVCSVSDHLPVDAILSF